MKKYLFILLLLTSFSSVGQTTKTIDNAIEEVKTSRVLMDSIHANLKSYTDSLADVNYTTNNESVFNTLTKESNNAAKKKAIFRIVLGIGLLVLLIVGLRRKTKKPVN
jgi:hypothetical protein